MINGFLLNAINIFCSKEELMITSLRSLQTVTACLYARRT